VIGSMQALETLKILMNVGETLSGKLLLFDALTMEWQMIRVRKHPKCKTCQVSTT
jgi:adenylyltransferase/sulfurtransferase